MYMYMDMYMYILNIYSGNIHVAVIYLSTLRIYGIGFNEYGLFS